MNANFGKAHGGIGIDNLSPTLASLIPDAVTSLHDSAGSAIQVSEAMAVRPGVRASNTLYLPADVVDADLITVGDDTFEVSIVNTDTTRNLNGALDGTSDPVMVTLAAAPGVALTAGDLIRVENEILKVLQATPATFQYVCARARCGTVIAAHIDGSDVYQAAAPVTAGHIPVGLVATLTTAVFGPAFVAEFNNALAGVQRATAKASTEYVNFTAYSLASKGQVLVVANYPGVNVTACTEDFANSTDNVWANATMVGGYDPGVLGSELAVHAVTAAEALSGQIHIPFPFSVRECIVQFRITATGIPVAWDGQIVKGYAETTTEVLPDKIVSLLNEFASSTAYHTVFDSTMTAYVYAVE